jgi:hypothetical protein
MRWTLRYDNNDVLTLVDHTGTAVHQAGMPTTCAQALFRALAGGDVIDFETAQVTPVKKWNLKDGAPPWPTV